MNILGQSQLEIKLISLLYSYIIAAKVLHSLLQKLLNMLYVKLEIIYKN